MPRYSLLQQMLNLYFNFINEIAYMSAKCYINNKYKTYERMSNINLSLLPNDRFLYGNGPSCFENQLFVYTSDNLFKTFLNYHLVNNQNYYRSCPNIECTIFHHPDINLMNYHLNTCFNHQLIFIGEKMNLFYLFAEYGHLMNSMV